jgi:hypothetical protein
MKEDHFVLLTTTLVAGLALASQYVNLNFRTIDTLLVSVVQQSEFVVMFAASPPAILESLLSFLGA